MQIGPIKYGKSEEMILFKSMMLGIFLGLPLDMLLNYLLGFPMVAKGSPTDFWGWVVFISSWMGSICSLWFLITTAFCFLFYSKEGLISSWRDIVKVVWALLIFFPVLFTYTAFIVIAIFVPLDYATPWLSPVRRLGLSFLLFLPFLFLFVLIFLPDQKPRKLVNQLWLVLKRKNPIPTFGSKKMIASLLIFAWLLLVFLPIPESPLTHFITIGGGLAIIAFFMRQNSKKKKKVGRLTENR